MHDLSQKHAISILNMQCMHPICSLRRVSFIILFALSFFLFFQSFISYLRESRFSHRLLVTAEWRAGRILARAGCYERKGVDRDLSVCFGKLEMSPVRASGGNNNNSEMHLQPMRLFLFSIVIVIWGASCYEDRLCEWLKPEIFCEEHRRATN